MIGTEQPVDVLGPKQRFWVNELKSGKYKQTAEILCYDDHYCCLGVANKCLDLEEESLETLQNSYSSLLLNDDVGGFDETIYVYGKPYDSLVAMNDARLNFQEIAAVIENYWHIIFTGKV